MIISLFGPSPSRCEDAYLLSGMVLLVGDEIITVCFVNNTDGSVVAQGSSYENAPS